MKKHNEEKVEDTSDTAGATEAIMTYEEVMEKTRERLTVELVGFDPTIIIAIVSAILQLLGVKSTRERTPQAVQDCCKRRPFAALVRLNLFMQREGVPLKHRSQAAQAILKMGEKATFEEVVAFCNCCDTTFEGGKS